MRCSIVIAVAVAACSGDDVGDSDWMASLPDSANLATLTIPGTHDSGAQHEPAAGIAQTQNLTFADQLSAGVRYFDVRCRNFDDQFLIYHGSIDQSQTYDDVLAAMYSFLDAHPKETIIISVKEELDAQGATMSFEQVFDNYVALHPERWYLGATVPAVGDVRGKLVLLRRFESLASPLGIAGPPTVWADNATFTITDADATLRIEDNYIVTDDSVKWTDITSLFGEARGNSDPATLYLAYTSGYQTIMSLPNIPSVSDTIDAMLDSFFADPANVHARFGIVVMDFVTAARVRAVLSTN